MKIQKYLFMAVFTALALLLTSSSPRTNLLPGFIGNPIQSVAIPSITAGNLFNDVAIPQQPSKGEQIYKEKCIVCHQADGKGLPGAFPPLAGSDYLLADKVRAVAQVLNGSNMEITVNKVKYVAPMPPQVNTKEDAVAIINYVLNNFGNKGGQVTLEEVKDVVINPRK
jgi:mono/diheme cytochrome c family protein